MSFNSVDFAIFFTIVFLLYWTISYNSLNKQNIDLLAASYFFYGWWDWRLLFLIIFISVFNYYFGLKFLKVKKETQRKILLLFSLSINLIVLGFFKYYNFFIDSISGIFSILGYSLNVSSLNILLPVGISFYTFQNISYLIDVYREEILPEKKILVFLTFIAFFPKLVTGPIEKANNILPQIKIKRVFDYDLSADGLRQILWGLFKKIVIADNCAFFVNEIFSNSSYYSGSTLIIGIFLFSIQIYADFSGYSDLAIGTAKLLGIKLMVNFNYPYFSTSVAEFWRRWHISLSNWLRDYLFIPLQFKYRNLAVWGNVISLLITFLLCGLWHGANWTFIFWGFLHGFYMSFALVTKNIKVKVLNYLIRQSHLKQIVQTLITFILIGFAWIFFKVDNLRQGFEYVKRIFTNSILSIPQVTPKSDLLVLLLLIFFFLIVEWLHRDKEYAIKFSDNKKSKLLRWCIYYTTLFLIFSFGGTPNQFIYIQF